MLAVCPYLDYIVCSTVLRSALSNSYKLRIALLVCDTGSGGVVLHAYHHMAQGKLGGIVSQCLEAVNRIVDSAISPI